MTLPNQPIRTAYQWVTGTGAGASAPAEVLAQTRDVFRSRLERFYRESLTTASSEAESALLTAVVGEIGNNCFDHNLGQWRDVPGCWFGWGREQETLWIVVA